MWLDKANVFSNQNALQNKQVLDVGCAKGFLVKSLRDLGVDAYGIDVSQYAIDNSEDGMDSYLTVADARTYLATYSNRQWDWLISLRFLECIDEAELPALVSEMNRVSKSQIHVIDTEPNPLYYVVRDLAWWGALDWARSTRLIQNENWDNIIDG
jgi:2-polyprenyl-3-methyl-5-hydroxy-6-metoxy-1,4-benzoquinol methylase